MLVVHCTHPKPTICDLESVLSEVGAERTVFEMIQLIRSRVIVDQSWVDISHTRVGCDES